MRVYTGQAQQTEMAARRRADAQQRIGEIWDQEEQRVHAQFHKRHGSEDHQQQGSGSDGDDDDNGDDGDDDEPEVEAEEERRLMAKAADQRARATLEAAMRARLAADAAAADKENQEKVRILSRAGTTQPPQISPYICVHRQ